MSRIELVNGSCADQKVDIVVNAANDGLWAGGGIWVYPKFCVNSNKWGKIGSK